MEFVGEPLVSVSVFGCCCIIFAILFFITLFNRSNTIDNSKVHLLAVYFLLTWSCCSEIGWQYHLVNCPASFVDVVEKYNKSSSPVEKDELRREIVERLLNDPKVGEFLDSLPSINETVNEIKREPFSAVVDAGQAAGSVPVEKN